MSTLPTYSYWLHISRSSMLAKILICLAALCIQAQSSASQWKLEKHDDHYQIFIATAQQDRLVLSHEGEDTHFILHTASDQAQPDSEQHLQIWFDNDTGITEVTMTRLKKLTYQINLDHEQKKKFLRQMINKITFHIRYLLKEHDYRHLSFSLLGFTAVLNDLLIAHEIGHLDPEWLNENHKTQELMCFYAANFSVLSILHRKNGLTAKQSISRIKQQYTTVLDELIMDIVRQVYNMPRTKLPRDPRGDKFGIFQRCMQAYQQ